MNAVKKDVESLVVKELNSANEQFPLFASLHEGYAVMLEEVEEAEEDMEHLKEAMKTMWVRIRRNNLYGKYDKASDVLMESIKTIAVHLACEAIQVAAMAEKMIVSEREKNEKQQ